MARNKVQFQKGLSEAGFEAVYGTEEKCRAAVIAVTMAEWLRMPGLRRAGVLRGAVAWAVPVQRLPPPDLAHRRHDLSPRPICLCACGSAPCIT